jgi:predicted RNA-binding Zn-ribbon protein involved in translation (DUF1610 family)
MVCPDCGKAELTDREQEVEFVLGRRKPVTLKAKAPVASCPECGLRLTDWRMERAQCLAISAYLHREEKPDEVPEPYRSAHALSLRHRKQLERAGRAGCFYCLAVFDIAAIKDWTDDEQTALCPKCGIDAVLPAGQMPEGDIEFLPDLPGAASFLRAMRQEWFAIAKTL